MKYIFLTLLLFIFLNKICLSQVLGTGFGITQDDARKEALADISSQISVQIKVTSETKIKEITGTGYSEDYTRQLITRTELPILGAKLDYQKKKGGVQCNAIIDKNSVKLYEKELNSKIAEAQKLMELNDLNSISSLMSLSEEFIKYKIVLVHLGGELSSNFPITNAELQTQFEKKAGSLTSLTDFEKIAKLIFTDEVYFVFPAEVDNSKEITPFASIVRERLHSVLKTTSSIENATFKLIGVYTILDNSIDLTYRAVDSNGTTTKSASFRFESSAYDGIKYKPETVGIEKLIQQGLVLTNDIRPEIKTTKGKTNLLFKGGEQIELMVKLNRPGYLYLIAHTNNEEGKFSYLVPINGSETKRDFVLFINADDANKWISLGAFDVVPPYGTEIVQVFASSSDLVDSVPDFYIENDYPVIGKKAEEVVVKTRGIIKSKKKKEVEGGETVLTFTTISK